LLPAFGRAWADPPPAPATPAWDAQVDVIDLTLRSEGPIGPLTSIRELDSKTLSERIAATTKPKVLILADVLHLSDWEFRLKDGAQPLQQIVILANRIVFESKATFTLEAPTPLKSLFLSADQPLSKALLLPLNDPKVYPNSNGRSLALIANEIDCSRGLLNVFQRDWLSNLRSYYRVLIKPETTLATWMKELLTTSKYEELRKGEAGVGGDLLLMANRYHVPGASTEQTENLQQIKTNHLYCVQTGETQNGKLNCIVSWNKETLLTHVPEEALRVWMIRRLEKLRSQLVEAQIHDDKATIASVVANASMLPSLELLDETRRIQATGILQSIHAAKSELKPFFQSLNVRDSNGAFRTAAVRWVPQERVATVIPQSLRIVSMNTEHGEKSGLTALENDDTVRVSITAKLSIDSQFANKLSEEISRKGYSFGGIDQTVNWTVADSTLFQSCEIRNIGDSTATISLAVPKERIGTVVSYLATNSGLPLGLTFTSTSPEWTGNVSTSISFQHRVQHPLQVEGLRLVNTDQQRPWAIRSVFNSQGRRVVLKQEHTVPAGGSITLPNELGFDDCSTWDVDPESVRALVASERAFDELVVDAGQVIDNISIVNQIPHATTNEGKLVVVRGNVSYIIEADGKKVETAVGAFDLYASGSAKDRQVFQTFRARAGRAKVRVLGEAVFENGVYPFDLTHEGATMLLTVDKILPAS
jgi:hypothetical protein